MRLRGTSEHLARLLRQNHECYAEEVALGLHEKEAKGKAAKKGKASNGKGGGNKESTLFLIRWHPLLSERCKVMEKTLLATLKARQS